MTRAYHVAVTGATGFVARHVRRYLYENGAKLSSISRIDFKNLQSERKVITKNYDPKTILPKIRECDALIHLVGIGSQSIKNDFNSVNFQLTKKILELCQKTRIKKIIYLSGLGVSKNNLLEYFLSKYRAENVIRQSGIDFTIFRPSYIVGRGDLLTKHLKRQIRRGSITIPGSGRFQIQPISINDVSKVISKSLTSKKFSNKTLDLVGPELMTYESYTKQFSRHTRTRIKKIPLEEAYCNAITKHNYDFGVDDLNLLVGNFYGDFKKLERAANMKFQLISKSLQARILS